MGQGGNGVACSGALSKTITYETFRAAKFFLVIKNLKVGLSQLGG